MPGPCPVRPARAARRGGLRAGASGFTPHSPRSWAREGRRCVVSEQLWLFFPNTYLAAGRRAQNGGHCGGGVGKNLGNRASKHGFRCLGPLAQVLYGLIERRRDTYVEKLASLVATGLWGSDEELVFAGEEGSVSACKRMADTLTEVMLDAGGHDVLAVSHGSATLQFKKAWEHLVVCDQNVPPGNCCILVYEFDRAARTFTCDQIVNHEAVSP